MVLLNGWLATTKLGMGRQVVHVAGTKGKGSTVSFIGSILRAAGLSVGTYTRYCKIIFPRGGLCPWRHFRN